jgi:hypothetical protein
LHRQYLYGLRAINQVFSILFVLVLTSICHAQVYEPVRIELSAHIESPTYHLENLGEEGAMVFYESNEIDENLKRRWYFSMLDSTLTEQWVQIVPVSDGMSVHTSTAINGSVVILFTNEGSRTKSQSTNYEILTYKNKLKKFNLLGGTVPEKAEISGFCANESTAFMSVNLPKSAPDLLVFNLEKGGLHPLVHNLEGDISVKQTGMISNGMFFTSTLEQIIEKKKLTYHFIITDRLGNKVRQIIWNDLQNRRLHAFAFDYDPISDGFIINGSYGFDKPKKDSRRQEVEEEEEADGLFYLKFPANGTQIDNFVPFSDFKDISSALASEELMLFRQQQARSESENVKPDVGFRLFHPVIVSFEGLNLFTAEAFRPKYRLETRVEYDIYGRPIPYTYSVFEGYHFYTSILAAFDSSGRLSWSGNFKIPETVSLFLQAHTLVHPDSTGLLVCLTKNGLIHSSVYDKNGIETGGLEQTKLVSDFANDRLLEEAFTSISYWYDDFFLASGTQKIANNKLRDNNPRIIYYINKIGFR